MREHPIIFSTPMVQAILDGRKTMTRRIIKPQPNKLGDVYKDASQCYREEGARLIWVDGAETHCKYLLGDILWVRESFLFNDSISQPYAFKADHNEEYQRRMKGYWKPSIYMPKEAARIWLQVTDIKVERVQDITEQDAIVEGVESNECSPDVKSTCISEFCKKEGCAGTGEYFNYNGIDLEPAYSAAESFKTLWQSINGSESWNSNPWVWAITFKQIKSSNKMTTKKKAVKKSASKKKAAKPRTVNRNSISGEFTTDAEVKKHPESTTTERIK